MGYQIPTESRHYELRNTRVQAVCGNCTHGAKDKETLWCNKDLPWKRTKDELWCAEHSSIKSGDAVMVQAIVSFVWPFEPADLNWMQKFGFRLRRIWTPKTKIKALRLYWRLMYRYPRWKSIAARGFWVLVGVGGSIVAQWLWTTWLGKL